ncbi:MAG TPA: glutamate-5-semialdehyde dehydrogenase [Fibrobacteraceae bacterium]|nr:glutamate-5-semialdehyde dehydrogenase [Fibrobacteraceae bacterium]
MENKEYVNQLALGARKAAQGLRALDPTLRDKVLLRVAVLLRANTSTLLAANQKDLELAKSQGLSKAMLDRLTLTEARVADMAKGVEEIAGFPDPLDRVLESRRMVNGAELRRVTTPIGAVLFIYESRPNVTIDGAALCFKSGNAVILRGGKESLVSSKALAALFRQALEENGVHPDAVQLVDVADRALVNLLLQRNDALDLVIPRGGEGLIRAVMDQSTIPVIKHYKGVCHIYVDQSADLEMAEAILVNAKVQRPSACNAMETLLLHRALGAESIRSLLSALTTKGVELHGCAETCEIFPEARPMGDMAEYHREYLDLELSVRVVSGVEDAVEHIETYSSRHTDAVLAMDPRVQEYFLAHVDSSSVMVNASTRLADGGVYGLGAEVGISTDKLHARGPMGVESLCTYKWVILGTGQVR